MSHIGKRKINIPDNIDFKIEANAVKVKGPKGEISVMIPLALEFKLEAGEFSLFPKSGGKKADAIWGLTNALVSNAVKGVVDGFSRQLEIKGVGYRANVQGNKLVLLLGFSHPMEITAPQGIAFVVEKNIITISGIDKQLVGEIAAKIRDMKKPEPYKGKGIRYVGEYVRQKAGKKATGSGF
ncbi:MAG: 50S ribosomal protein L6 [Parcubacteria group bacterium GW2011_GWA2_38_13b]|nr:MAG: 50S ribosomal protein L6 [Parcubacteria group bacterium GW2011_GWA2_38_13b]